MDLRELESLYDEFAPAGYAFALQLTQDSAAAQDLVQSVFLRLARRPRFTILNPRSFVLRCIYRAHVDVVRRDATRRQMLENFALEAQPPFRPDPDEDEKIAELLEQLAALPEEQRVVVHLRTWEQRTLWQIVGEPVGLHPLTVTIKVPLKRYFWDRPPSSPLESPLPS